MAAAGLLGLALLGCGGGDDAARPEATQTSAASPTEAAATAGESPTETPEPTSESSQAPGSGDDEEWGRLPDLDSYRYSFKLEGTAGLIAEVSGADLPPGVDPESGKLTFSVEGAYVNPDRGEATISIGDQSLTKIVIGNQVWDDTGNGFEGPKQLSAGGESDYSFVATFWDTEGPPPGPDM